MLTPIEHYKFTCRDIMRYETLGDYFTTKKGMEIQTYSKLSPIERKAVAIHELVEHTLLELKGITPEQVTEWDTEDSNGKYNPSMYDKNDWYKKADEIALYVERQIIEWAGLNWTTYDDDIDAIEIKYNLKKLNGK